MSDETFRENVRSVTNDIIFFIDPDNIDKENIHSADNIRTVRDALNVNSSNLGQVISDEEARVILTSSLGGAGARGIDIPSNALDPSAAAGETSHICLVIEQESARTRQESIQAFTGLSPNRLKEKLSLDQLDRFSGAHEGTHCDTPSSQLNQLLGNEVRADSNAMIMMESQGDSEFSQILTDYRTIGTAHKLDPVHATGVALENGGVSDVTLNYVRATSEVKPSIDALFLKESGYFNTDKMIRLNPERYVRTIETALDNDEFKVSGNPDLEEHIRAYTEAFRRQIKGVAPLTEISLNVNSSSEDQKTAFVDLNDIKGGEISVDLAGGDSASMTIGEVTASDFFASFAHPELANQRIALQEAAINPALDFSINQNNVATMSV